MNLNAKKIIYTTILLFALYYVLKIILFVMQVVFNGVVSIFTSGIIYLIIIGFVLFKYRTKFIKPKILIKKQFNSTKEENKNSTNPNNTQFEEKKPTNNKKEEKDQAYKRRDTTIQNEEILEKSDLLTFTFSISVEELKNLLDNAYYGFSTKFSNQKGFGESGAVEFARSIILSVYDPRLSDYICKGIEQVFLNSSTPTDLKIYMDHLIDNIDNITYSQWTQIYNFLYQEHSWILHHPCSYTRKTLNAYRAYAGSYSGITYHTNGKNFTFKYEFDLSTEQSLKESPDFSCDSATDFLETTGSVVFLFENGKSTRYAWNLPTDISNREQLEKQIFKSFDVLYILNEIEGFLKNSSIWKLIHSVENNGVRIEENNLELKDAGKTYEEYRINFIVNNHLNLNFQARISGTKKAPISIYVEDPTHTMFELTKIEGLFKEDEILNFFLDASKYADELRCKLQK